GAIASDEVDHLRDDAVGRESIESSFVEDLVGAVVACIRTTHAGGVGEFANAAELFIGIEVSQIEGRDGKRIKRFYFAVYIMDAATVVFPRKSGDVVERFFERDRLC